MFKLSPIISSIALFETRCLKAPVCVLSSTFQDVNKESESDSDRNIVQKVKVPYLVRTTYWATDRVLPSIFQVVNKYFLENESDIYRFFRK